MNRLVRAVVGTSEMPFSLGVGLHFLAARQLLGIARPLLEFDARPQRRPLDRLSGFVDNDPADRPGRVEFGGQRGRNGFGE